jgi:hypothetical protein
VKQLAFVTVLVTVAGCAGATRATTASTAPTTTHAASASTTPRSSMPPTSLVTRGPCRWAAKYERADALAGSIAHEVVIRNVGRKTCVTPRVVSASAKVQGGKWIAARDGRAYWPDGPGPVRGDSMPPGSKRMLSLISPRPEPCLAKSATTRQIVARLSDGASVAITLGEPAETGCGIYYGQLQRFGS